MRTIRRQHLGAAASAAVALVWSLMDERDWSLADLARALEEDTGLVSRWVYGDQKPGRKGSAKFAALGVDVSAWDEPLPKRWRLPHAA